MRGVRDPDLKACCIQLRLEKRMSLSEIQAQTGAPKGSLSTWLAAYPLTEEEQALRQRGRARYQTPKKERGTPSALYALGSTGELSRLQKAKVAEAAVMLRLVLMGYNPFGSVFDGDKTDWLCEVPQTGKVCKIQVKWAKVASEGLPLVSLLCGEGSSGLRRYRRGEFDFITGYDLFTDTAYVWSWGDVEHLKHSVTVHPDAAERWDKLLM